MIEPFAESRSNHEVMQGLATRLGARHPGFDLTAAELIDATLKASNHPDFATLREKKWQQRRQQLGGGTQHTGGQQAGGGADVLDV